uniref:Jag N-terminal domain-containing protein n=1 Tax=Levilactobacillus suantsaii TaxID=2292255 RepID=UPI001CDB7473
MTIFTGKTEAAAIAAGLATLTAKRDQVTVKVVRTARKGWLGIGRRDAQVDVQLKAAQPAPAVQPAKQPVHSQTPPAATASQPQKAAVRPAATPASASTKPASQPAHDTATPKVQPAHDATTPTNREAAIKALTTYVTTIVS